MELRPRSAKAIVLELLSVAPGGSVSVQGLLRAVELFEISDNNLRVTLARLKRAELIEAAARGHYRLGRRARPIQERVMGWRDILTRLRPWKGAWIGVHTASLPRSDRVAARRRDWAFRLTGMRSLSDGLMARPDNLRGSVDAIRDHLHDLGVDPAAPVFRMSCLDGAQRERLLALWDTQEVSRTYSNMSAALRRAQRDVRSMPLADAARMSFVLGGDAIRIIALDPLLPAELVDADAREDLVSTMIAFDETGRALWRTLMSTASERVLSHA